MGGRPEFAPTDEQRNLVKNLAAAGVCQNDIADMIADGIDPKTLRKHFVRELTTSKNFITALATSKVVAAINNNEAWGICFWLKTRAGWKETNVTEHTGKNGGPIELTRVREEVAATLAGLPPELRNAVAAHMLSQDGQEG